MCPDGDDVYEELCEYRDRADRLLILKQHGSIKAHDEKVLDNLLIIIENLENEHDELVESGT